jgi:hypothetical protein
MIWGKEVGMKVAELALGASNVLLGTAVGAGVDQSLFVMPHWFTSPPESVSTGQAGHPLRSFWIPLQAGCALALGGALALNRRQRHRRNLLALALGLYAGTWAATTAYFTPEVMRLGDKDSVIAIAESTRRGRRWLRLTWGRHLVLGAAWVLTALAWADRPRPLRLA